MEWIGVIFVFFAVIVITALLFGGWVIFSIIRLIVGGIAALAAPKQPTMIRQPVDHHAADLHTARCPNAKCRHANPATAQFCRQCGTAMPGIQRVTVQRTQTGYARRVAMW